MSYNSGYIIFRPAAREDIGEGSSVLNLVAAVAVSGAGARLPAVPPGTVGTPDMELNLFMTDDGMQFEVVNTASGQRSRNTMTWAEVFAK